MCSFMYSNWHCGTEESVVIGLNYCTLGLVIVSRPGGVLVSKGEHVSSSLRHAAFHLRNNKVETSLRLVQGKFYVHL